jgi:hypothetical protein
MTLLQAIGNYGVRNVKIEWPSGKVHRLRNLRTLKRENRLKITSLPDTPVGWKFPQRWDILDLEELVNYGTIKIIT